MKCGYAEIRKDVGLHYIANLLYGLKILGFGARDICPTYQEKNTPK